MKKKLFILIIEDSQNDAELNAGMLRKAGYDVSFQRVETEEEMTEALTRQSWDLILSDYSMPQFSVGEALHIYHANGTDIPFIVISGAIGEEKAVELIKAGAHDYLLKNRMSKFIMVVERALREAENRRERIKLNDELASSQARYKSYIDNAPDGVFVVDNTGKYIEVNQAACRMTGYTETELLSMSIWDIFYPENAKKGRADFKKLLKTGSSRADLSFRHKNGTKRWMALEAVKLTETRLLGFAKDITKRKELEESLRTFQNELIMQNEELIAARSVAQDAAEKYTELYDFAPTGYFTLTADKKIRELNHSGSQMLGAPRSQVVGCDFEIFVSRHSRPVFKAFFQSVFKSNAKETCELIIETKGNQPIHLYMEGIVAADRKQCLINAIDNTGVKMAEEALKQTSARLALATQAGGVGVWDLNLVSNELIWDDQMFKLHGVDKPAYFPSFLSWQARIHPDDREKILTEIKMAVRGDKEYDTEFRVFWPDGSLHSIRANAVILRNKSGKPVRSIGTNWDITEQKQLEEKLRSSEINFRNFFESMNDLIFVGNTEGKIIYTNDAVSRKLGYSGEELLNMQVIGLHSQEQHAEAARIIGEMFAGKRDICPLPLVRKNGAPMPVETRVWLGKWNGKDCIFGFSKDLSAEQEALQKFNRIFNSNPALMAISTFPDNVFTDVNDTFLAKTGYAREEISGRSSADVDLFMQPEKHREAAAALMEKGFIHNLELQIRTKPGIPLDGLFSGEIIETQGKKFFLTVMVDITARKKAEEEIHRVNRFLDSIVENIPNMIFLKDAKTLSFVQFNKAGEELLGMPREELLGKNDYDFFTREQADNFTARDRQVLMNRNLCVIPEEPIQTKHKGLRLLHTSKVPILDDRGEPEYLLGISEDITERRQAEAELQLRGEIIENIAEGVFLFRASDGIIVYSNPKCERMFGYNSGELAGKHVSIVNAPTEKTPRETADMIIGKLKETGTWQGEVRNIRKDGTRFWNQANISAFDHPQYGNVWISIQHDITERKLAGEELRRSEERFRHVSSTISDISYSCRINQDGNYMIDWMTGAAERITGYSIDEIKAKKCWGKLVMKQDLDLFREHVLNLAPGASSTCELRLQHKNGSLVWVDSFAECINSHENDGKNYLYGGLVNITDRKRAGELLRESEELFRSVVFNSSDLTILTDISGQITFCSPQCSDVIGYHCETFLGQKVPVIMYPEDAEVFHKAWDNVFPESDQLREFEYRIIDAQGKTRWLSHTVKLVSIGEKVLGIHSTIRNITERKIVEQMLRESEEKHKTILNASPDGILVTNLKGIITDVSEIGIELLGASSREGLIGKNFLRFVPSDEKNTIREINDKTLNEGLAQNIELKIRKMNQDVFTGETSATLIQGSDGTPVSFMIILRNISQRKKMETLQIHADRMANLGEMATGIAHEINQPLNIISMVTDKILFESSRAETIDLEFLKNKSNKIFDNITRIRNIIDHIRAFSRSHNDFVLSAFDINASIENATSMISEQFKHLGIILQLQLEKRFPSIYGNTYQFEQVILNLLVNAKDAVLDRKNKQGDTFEMMIVIRSCIQNQFLVVEVTDNGIGIGHDDINNVILPFYTTKDEGKGTGLGLSICYQIIKEMGGTIEIISDTSSGTTVKLMLTIQEKNAKY